MRVFRRYICPKLSSILSKLWNKRNVCVRVLSQTILPRLCSDRRKHYRTQFQLRTAGQVWLASVIILWKETIGSVSILTLYFFKHRNDRYVNSDFPLILGLSRRNRQNVRVLLCQHYIVININFKCLKCYTFWLNRGKEAIKQNFQ